MWKKFPSVSEIGNSDNRENVSRMKQTGTHEKWTLWKISCPHWRTKEKCWLTWLIVSSWKCLYRWNPPWAVRMVLSISQTRGNEESLTLGGSYTVVWVNTHTKEAIRLRNYSAQACLPRWNWEQRNFTRRWRKAVELMNRALKPSCKETLRVRAKGEALWGGSGQPGLCWQRGVMPRKRLGPLAGAPGAGEGSPSWGLARAKLQGVEVKENFNFI